MLFFKGSLKKPTLNTEIKNLLPSYKVKYKQKTHFQTKYNMVSSLEESNKQKVS